MGRTIDPAAVGIRTAIAQKGLMKRYVAEQSGFTEQQFSDMLNGRKVIKAEYLPAIAKAIGVHISDLFVDAGQPSA